MLICARWRFRWRFEVVEVVDVRVRRCIEESEGQRFGPKMQAFGI